MYIGLKSSQTLMMYCNSFNLRSSMHTQKNVGTKRISDEIIYEVCSYVRVGVPTETAAIASGISKNDYLLWMREGESPHHNERCQDCDFSRFFKEISMARAQAIGLFFACITKAAIDGEWEASAWWLDKYGNINEQDNSKTYEVPTLAEIQRKLRDIYSESGSEKF
jgi:hypothetical protein